MSAELLKQYITEVMQDMAQNIIRKDPEGSGKLVLRKLVTYTKSGSRYAPGEDVDTELRRDGTVTVDDIENWKPEFSKTIRKPRRLRKSSRRLA